MQTYSIPIQEYVCGEVIRVQRGARTSSEFTVLWEDNEYVVIGNDGVSTVVQTREYTFRKDVYVIDGEATEPQRGDMVLHDTHVFKISPTQDKPAVEEDSDGLCWVARTNRVK